MIVAFSYVLQCDGSDQESVSPVLIKRLLTPRKLQNIAYLGHLSNANVTVLHFTAIASRARLLRFTLNSLGTIPPGALSNLAISIQAHFLESPTSDTDPLVAICDGTTCNGIDFNDRGNYPNPCAYYAMTPGPTATNYVRSPGHCGGETVETNFTHPKTVSLTFVPSERWGSFSIPEGNGFTTASTFGAQLDPTQGLSVEMYGSDTGEQYRLAYMIVEVISEE